MITAIFKKENNQYVSYSISGHANFAPKGQDIICAGVSALYIAVTNVLIKEHAATIDVDGSIQLGIIKDSQYIVTVLYENLCEIAKEYSNHIEIVNRDEKSGAN